MDNVELGLQGRSDLGLLSSPIQVVPRPVKFHEIAMAILLSEQLEFLEAQSIPLTRVFNATGMTRERYRLHMEHLEAVVAYGTSPCKRSGHTLRTRAGHCAQCNTHALGFLLRYDEPGEVYVAVSARFSLVKVGTSQDARSRMNNLNSYGYGGASDWNVHSRVTCKKAGRVEFRAHRTLFTCRAKRTYMKTGDSVQCQELFTCSPDVAAEAVRLAELHVEGA